MIETENIRVTQLIIHILQDGFQKLSETKNDIQTDFTETIKAHICKIFNSDETKRGIFAEDSEVKTFINSYDSENFVDISRALCEQLHSIMQQNYSIPECDFMVAEFELDNCQYLALLKMNYKEYMVTVQEEKRNNIAKVRKAIPPSGTKLQEAAVICLEDNSIMLNEKKFEINGVKVNYFSSIFLKCLCGLSNKAKLSLFAKAYERIIDKYYTDKERYKAYMKLKAEINYQLEEEGYIRIDKACEEVFNEEQQKEIQELIEPKGLAYNGTIEILNESTTRKYMLQELSTETGIGLAIPMDIYRANNVVEEKENEDGTKDLIIKNISYLESR